MEVILLEKIRKLGELGAQVRIKAGYGRNFLFPQGKAIPATADNIAKFEAKRAEFEKTQAEVLNSATARVDNLNNLSVTIQRKAGAEGKLYGSVGTADIAEAAKLAGVELTKQEVKLPTGPFRMIGEYDVEINLHADIDVVIKVIVVPEEN